MSVIINAVLLVTHSVQGKILHRSLLITRYHYNTTGWSLSNIKIPCNRRYPRVRCYALPSGSDLHATRRQLWVVGAVLYSGSMMKLSAKRQRHTSRQRCSVMKYGCIPSGNFTNGRSDGDPDVHHFQPRCSFLLRLLPTGSMIAPSLIAIFLPLAALQLEHPSRYTKLVLQRYSNGIT